MMEHKQFNSISCIKSRTVLHIIAAEEKQLPNRDCIYNKNGRASNSAENDIKS